MPKVSVTGEYLDWNDEVVEEHCHPPYSVVFPSGNRRRGAITFTTAANDENVVVGLGSGITYTFKTTLTGDPGSNNVWVKVQGSVDDTVRILAQAVMGVTDAVNIKYGPDPPGTVWPHPNVQGWYTGVRFAIGAVQHAAGSAVFFQELATDQDSTAPLTLTTTTTGTKTDFVRTYTTRYLFTGNAAGLEDRVAGPYQMVVPMGYVFYPGTLTEVVWDPNLIVVEAVSGTGIVMESDWYYSEDESTYVQLSEGLNLTRETIVQGSQQYLHPNHRIPPGAGLYAKMRSSGTVTTDWVDVKVQYHVYPTDMSLEEDINR